MIKLIIGAIIGGVIVKYYKPIYDFIKEIVSTVKKT